MPTERLDSWKAVAGYLKRDVTTVQRWERREGMPVHRHIITSGGSVYALTSELDAWRQGRAALLATEGEGEEGAVGGCGWSSCRAAGNGWPRVREWVVRRRVRGLVGRL